jgi:hypothetical protein
MPKSSLKARTTPASSWVEADVFDQANKALFLKTQSGSHYRYDGVSADVYDAYAAMSSAGQAFNQLIKGQFIETSLSADEFDSITKRAKKPSKSGRLNKAAKQRVIWRKQAVDGRLLGFWF